MSAKETQTTFQQTVALFTSILTLVVITFIINIAYDSILFQKLGASGFFLLFAIEVFVYSGIYGQIVELVSGEEKFITTKRIIKNSQQFWLTYLGIHFGLFGLFAIYFFSFSTKGHLSFNTFYIHFHIFAVYLMTSKIIFTKYLKGKKNLRPNCALNFAAMGILLGLYLADLLFLYFPSIVPLEFSRLNNVIAFLQECTHYLQFIFLSILIVKQHPQIPEQFQVTDGKELYLIAPIGGGVFYSLGSLILKKNFAVFVVLRALSPKNYKIWNFNQHVWHKRYYKGNVLVAITSYTVNSYRAYKIAKGFKACGAKVVMGGPHMGCLPDEALEFCDSVVIGEAEAVWKQVIKDYENGCLQKTYTGGTQDVFSDEVQKEILNSPEEEMKDYIETTRGCKYRCDFCTIPAICGNKVRKKSIDHVISVIKKLKHKYKAYSFLDNNIYCDPPYARELFHALKPLNISWGAGCSIDIAKNKEDLNLAKESGCKGILIGYEIIENSHEKNKGGKLSYVNKYIQYSKAINKTGISIHGSFITAWEDDKWISLWKLLYFVFKIHPQFSIANILTPLPNSKFYNQLLEENRLVSLNWRNYGFNNLVFKHKHLNRRMFDFIFAVYRPVFFLVSSQYGNLYLIIIIYIILLFHFSFAKNLIFAFR